MNKKTDLNLISAVVGVVFLAAITGNTAVKAAENTVTLDNQSGGNMVVAVYKNVPAAKRVKGNAAITRKMRVSEIKYKECT